MDHNKRIKDRRKDREGKKLRKQQKIEKKRQ
jgi:hypothetical protein